MRLGTWTGAGSIPGQMVSSVGVQGFLSMPPGVVPEGEIKPMNLAERNSRSETCLWTVGLTNRRNSLPLPPRIPVKRTWDLVCGLECRQPQRRGLNRAVRRV